MIDHIGIPVSNVARATEFYLKALAPLGYGIVMEVSAEETGHGAAVGFGPPGAPDDFQSGKPSFWIGEGERLGGHIHVAFVAPSRPAVDAFYRAAIAAGGKDARTTTPTITAPSCSISTGTISRPCAMHLRSSSEAVAHKKPA
jgi:catechol 2,3-dioxygenase-like lactoylglutathione lyase family enzyme